MKTFPDIRSSTILNHIKEKNNLTKLDFSYSAYYRYMRVLRKQYGFKQTKGYSVYRMEADKAPGEEAQVDMGEMKLVNLKGGFTKVYFFVMVLSFSRMKYVYFSSIPFTSLSFIQAHDYAFRYFGGRCKTIRYDQDRVMVVSENAGNIVYVKEFKKYLDEVGFTIYLCKKEDPDSKGKVENDVKFVKTSFLDSRIYYGIDNLNQECLKWLDRTGNGTILEAIYRIQPDVFNKMEVKHLIKYEHEKISLF